jgi:hypothetical protein
MMEELWDEGTPLLKTLHPDIFRLDAEAARFAPGLDASARLRANLPQVIAALSVRLLWGYGCDRESA